MIWMKWIPIHINYFSFPPSYPFIPSSSSSSKLTPSPLLVIYCTITNSTVVPAPAFLRDPQTARRAPPTTPTVKASGDYTLHECNPISHP